MSSKVDTKLEIVYLGSLYGHNGIVTSIVVGTDSSGKPLVVSGGRDKRLIVWKLHLENPEAVVSDNKDSRKTFQISIRTQSLYFFFRYF